MHVKWNCSAVHPKFVAILYSTVCRHISVHAPITTLGCYKCAYCAYTAIILQVWLIQLIQAVFRGTANPVTAHKRGKRVPWLCLTFASLLTCVHLTIYSQNSCLENVCWSETWGLGLICGGFLVHIGMFVGWLKALPRKTHNYFFIMQIFLFINIKIDFTPYV